MWRSKAKPRHVNNFWTQTVNTETALEIMATTIQGRVDWQCVSLLDSHLFYGFKSISSSTGKFSFMGKRLIPPALGGGN
jgi:hypothetical protein